MTERIPLHGRDGYPVWQAIPLRWRDNNREGHVDNIVYYGWFIDALMGWLADAGFAAGQDGRTLFVVESGCRYAGELAYPGTVEIGIAVERLGTSSVRYRFGVFAEGTAEAAAEGFIVHVCVDAATRRPTPFLDEWRAAYQRALAPAG